MPYQVKVEYRGTDRSQTQVDEDSHVVLSLRIRSRKRSEILITLSSLPSNNLVSSIPSIVRERDDTSLRKIRVHHTVHDVEIMGATIIAPGTGGTTRWIKMLMQNATRLRMQVRKGRLTSERSVLRCEPDAHPQMHALVDADLVDGDVDDVRGSRRR